MKTYAKRIFAGAHLLLPLYILLIFFPLQILSSCPRCFDYKTGVPLLHLSVLFVLLSVILMLVKHWRPGFSPPRIMVGLSVALLVYGHLIPVPLGHLRNVDFFPSPDSITETWKWISFPLFALVWWLSSRVEKRFPGYLPGVLVLGLALHSGWTLISFPGQWKPKSASLSWADLPEVEKVRPPQPNIIHIILDRYAARYGLVQLKEGPEFRETLRGFEVFPFALSNYSNTEGSLPTLLQGENIPKNNVQQWLKIPAENNLPMTLKKKGYRTVLFGMEPSDYYGTGWDMQTHSLKVSALRMNTSFLRNATIHLMDFSLARALPGFHWFFEQEKFSQKGPLALLLGVTSWDSLPNTVHRSSLPFFRWVTDQVPAFPKSNLYVFFHSYLSHRPYFLSPDCEVSKEFFHSPGPEHQIRHFSCVQKQLEAFFSALKEHGVFDSSAIIIHSDHGDTWEEWGPERVFFARKPPGPVERPLQYSDQPVRLENINAILRNTAALSPSEPFPRESSPSTKLFYIDENYKYVSSDVVEFRSENWLQFLDNLEINFDKGLHNSTPDSE